MANINLYFIYENSWWSSKKKNSTPMELRKIKIPQTLVAVNTILTQNVGNKGQVENLGLTQGQAHPTVLIPQGPNIDAHGTTMTFSLFTCTSY